MNNNKVKKIKEKQQGFAMLEVMLAILIIAIASFGVYKLYSASTTRNSITRTESVIGEVSSAVGRYASTYMAQPTVKNLVDANYVADDTLDSGKTNFVTPFGAMTYTQGASGYGSFELNFASSIPDRAIRDFVMDMKSSADVFVDGSETPVVDPSSIKSESMHSVKLVFPKGPEASK